MVNWQNVKTWLFIFRRTVTFYLIFQARELKSIHLDAEGHFVKLVLHKNHVNKYNIYNQVCYMRETYWPDVKFNRL